MSMCKAQINSKLARAKYSILATLLICMGMLSFSQPIHATTIKVNHVGQWTRTWYIPFTNTVIGTNQVWHIDAKATTLWITPGIGVDIAGVRFEKGPTADAYLTALGGGTFPAGEPNSNVDVSFDKTMFPDGPEYTSDVGDGSFFDVTFATPIHGEFMQEVDLTLLNLVISTPLDFMADPSLVNAFVKFTDGSMIAADFKFVPEPSSALLVAVGLAGWWRNRRQGHGGVRVKLNA